MATTRRFDFLRAANTRWIVLAVGLTCAWLFSGAQAQQRCANLNYDESNVGTTPFLTRYWVKMGSGSRIKRHGCASGEARFCKTFAI